jgi:hypothetical protein
MTSGGAMLRSERRQNDRGKHQGEGEDGPEDHRHASSFLMIAARVM